MKALRLVLITSVCAFLAFTAQAQVKTGVKIGENPLETSDGHWLEIDETDALFIVDTSLYMGITNNPHRPDAANPNLDALMLKLYGYGLNNFLPTPLGARGGVQHNYALGGPRGSNVFLGITSTGEVMEVPLEMIIDTGTNNIALHNGVDTFGTLDLSSILDANNFYSVDGSFDENRTVDGANRTLTFNNLDSFTLNSNDFITLNGDQIALVQGGTDTILGINNLDELMIDATNVDINSTTSTTLTATDSVFFNTTDVVMSDTLNLNSYGNDLIKADDTDTIRGTILGTDLDGQVVEWTVEDILRQQPDSTIYTHDGTLTEDRTLDGASNSLTFSNLDSFNVNANTIDFNSNTTTTLTATDSVFFNTTDVVMSDTLNLNSYGNDLIKADDTDTIRGTILGTDLDGQVVEWTVQEILGQQADSSIYSQNGSLAEDRTLDGASNSLTFSNLDSFNVNANTIDFNSNTTTTLTATDSVFFNTTDVVMSDTLNLNSYGNDLIKAVDTDTIRGTILGTDLDGQVVEWTVEDILRQQPDSTIYTHDGTLTEDRTLDGASNSLTFSNLDSFEVNANTIDFNSNTTTTLTATDSVFFNTTDVVMSDTLNLNSYGNDLIKAVDTDTIRGTILGTDLDGQVVEWTVDDILRQQPDSTIYTHDGTLTEDRTLDGATNSLTFSNLDSFEVNANTLDFNSNTTTTITATDSVFFNTTDVVMSDTLNLNSYGNDLIKAVDTDTIRGTILGTDLDGQVVEWTVEDILRQQPDSVIYRHNGELTDQRTMWMAGNDLQFVGGTEAAPNSDTTIIHQDGTISIGRSTVRQYVGPPGNSTNIKLDIEGDIFVRRVHSSSDERFKKNISTIDNALDKVMQINGVTWNWRQEEFAKRNFSGDEQVGFIAQNIEKVLPQVVMTATDGYKSVDYAKVTALLTEAIKDQQKIIDELNGKLEVASTQNEELANEIASIKQMIKQISNLAESDED